ncbi:MAG: hypothetical protein PHN74_01925 [Candidatus Pacebacteria bacterium]|nr:hypothetical protein [Candidatus Paceibacterota bacterium]
MLVQTWADVLKSSLENLWIQVIGWLPSLVGALLIFVIGLIVAAGLRSLVEKVIGALKLDNLLKRVGIEKGLGMINANLNSGRFLGWIVYWFLIVAFLLASLDVLGVYALTDLLAAFLKEVLFYLTRVVVAIFIMVIAMLIGDIVGRLVRASLVGAKLHTAKFLGSAARWAIIVFGILAALSQLGIAAYIVNTLVTGIIAMIAIAGGLAFGLGGKEEASQIVREVSDELRVK